MDLHTENNGVARELTTNRLFLRPLTKADLPTVVTLVGDYDVSKMLAPVPHPYTINDAIDFLEMDARGELDVLWIITHNDTVVGAISIGKELGYWLGRPFWGQGFMTEAGIAAIDAYFTGRDVDTIQSSHFVENVGSQNVLRKLGFVDVGAHEHFSQARHAKVAGRQLQLTRQDWTMRPHCTA